MPTPKQIFPGLIFDQHAKSLNVRIGGLVEMNRFVFRVTKYKKPGQEITLKLVGFVPLDGNNSAPTISDEEALKILEARRVAGAQEVLENQEEVKEEA